MKKFFLLAMVVAILAAGMSVADDAGLAEYCVVSEMPVELEQVVDLFIPGLSGGKKFLSPKVNGLGLVHRWNPQLADATWKTQLQPGAAIRLPQEWVLRGIQGILEPVVTSATPRMEYNPSPLVGAHAWLLIVGVALIITPGGLWIFRRLGWM